MVSNQAIRVIQRNVPRTETGNSRAEVSQDGGAGVAHLALDRKLSTHVHLADPCSEDCNDDGGDNKDGRDEHYSCDPEEHEHGPFEDAMQHPGNVRVD